MNAPIERHRLLAISCLVRHKCVEIILLNAANGLSKQNGPRTLFITSAILYVTLFVVISRDYIIGQYYVNVLCAGSSSASSGSGSREHDSTKGDNSGPKVSVTATALGRPITLLCFRAQRVFYL